MSAPVPVYRPGVQYVMNGRPLPASAFPTAPGAWNRQISTSNVPPTEPLVSARPYPTGPTSPVSLQSMLNPSTAGTGYPMPRQVVSSYVAGPQAYNLAPVDMQMKRPSISFPAKGVQPLQSMSIPTTLASQPRQPIPVTRMPMQVSKTIKTVEKLPTETVPETAAAPMTETPEKEPVKVPSEMPVNVPSNKEELENVADNTKVEEQAKQLVAAAPKESRLTMVAKRIGQSCQRCLFCK